MGGAPAQRPQVPEPQEETLSPVIDRGPRVPYNAALVDRLGGPCGRILG